MQEKIHGVKQGTLLIAILLATYPIELDVKMIFSIMNITRTDTFTPYNVGSVHWRLFSTSGG